MRRFAPTLRRISSELPESIRGRVILELASDLEALAAHYRSRGLSEAAAAEQAEETLLVSPESLQRLIAVHTTPYQRWVSAAAGRLRWGLDLVLFVAGVLPILIAGVFVVGSQRPMSGESPLLWPILACAFGIAGIAAFKVHQLFVKRERSPQQLHRGLHVLVFLGAIGPLLGLLGGLLGLQRLVDSIVDYTGGSNAAIAERAGWDATLVVLGLLVAFGAGIVWFVLVNRIAAIEQEESALFLAME